LESIVTFPAHAMKWVLLQHLSGSRAPRLDVFSVTRHARLTLGRDPIVEIRFDARLEPKVGRWHARLVRCDDASFCFDLVDLDSLHGTYLNDVRVQGHRRLVSGDLIQLGPDGPRLRFVLQ